MTIREDKKVKLIFTTLNLYSGTYRVEVSPFYNRSIAFEVAENNTVTQHDAVEFPAPPVGEYMLTVRINDDVVQMIDLKVTPVPPTELFVIHADVEADYVYNNNPLEPMGLDISVHMKRVNVVGTRHTHFTCIKDDDTVVYDSATDSLWVEPDYQHKVGEPGTLSSFDSDPTRPLHISEPGNYNLRLTIDDDLFIWEEDFVVEPSQAFEFTTPTNNQSIGENVFGADTPAFWPDAFVPDEPIEIGVRAPGAEDGDYVLEVARNEAPPYVETVTIVDEEGVIVLDPPLNEPEEEVTFTYRDETVYEETFEITSYEDLEPTEEQVETVIDEGPANINLVNPVNADYVVQPLESLTSIATAQFAGVFSVLGLGGAPATIQGDGWVYNAPALNLVPGAMYPFILAATGDVNADTIIDPDSLSAGSHLVIPYLRDQTEDNVNYIISMFDKYAKYEVKKATELNKPDRLATAQLMYDIIKPVNIIEIAYRIRVANGEVPDPNQGSNP